MHMAGSGYIIGSAAAAVAAAAAIPGGGYSRVGGTISSSTARTDTAWYAIDGGADIPEGVYELIIRGASPTNVYELTWASCINATEQEALGATARGRAVWVNSPIAINISSSFPRLAVRALTTPDGAGWTAELAPII